MLQHRWGLPAKFKVTGRRAQTSENAQTSAWSPVSPEGSGAAEGFIWGNKKPKSIMEQRNWLFPEFQNLPSLHGSETPATPFPAPATWRSLAGLQS